LSRFDDAKIANARIYQKYLPVFFAIENHIVDMQVNNFHFSCQLIPYICA